MFLAKFWLMCVVDFPKMHQEENDIVCKDLRYVVFSTLNVGVPIVLSFLQRQNTIFFIDTMKSRCLKKSEEGTQVSLFLGNWSVYRNFYSNS